MVRRGARKSVNVLALKDIYSVTIPTYRRESKVIFVNIGTYCLRALRRLRLWKRVLKTFSG